MFDNGVKWSKWFTNIVLILVVLVGFMGIGYADCLSKSDSTENIQIYGSSAFEGEKGQTLLLIISTRILAS
jgi:hypothetical protein